MSAYRIHINGQVQGVGFRPFVWRTAMVHRVTGWVSNGLDGVHIEVNGTDEQCFEFYEAVISQAPPRARITGHAMEAIADAGWNGFVISESDAQGQPALHVTPDLAVCPSCKTEMLDPANRRYHYPFTTCTHCGPRYSILRDVPFDRVHTTMDEFQMCESCRDEYNAADSSRFYAQTNSCARCGVKLYLKGPGGIDIPDDAEDLISLAGRLLKRGEIIALKNLGGYLLLCDATQAASIWKLRERKRRPAKPFAVLYPDLDMLQADALVSAQEADALTGAEAPVVIVPARENTMIVMEAVAPGQAYLGAMLPYTPLMVLLMDHVQIPLVATSGNVNGSPIFFEDDAVMDGLAGIADYWILHNREIVTPQDDSVVRFAGDVRIMLRRARGFAPTCFASAPGLHRHSSIAMGSDLKSTLAFGNGKNLYVSQYLGDLEHYEVQQRYDQTLRHLTALSGVRPDVILVDQHPSFFSSRLGGAVAVEWNVPLVKVPHHEAHFCAVLAENNLLDAAQPVLGVIWDGTGWGADGNIWGGEFFTFHAGDLRRVAHLDYFDHLVGDKFAREPRLCALVLCKDVPEAMEILRPKFTHAEWSLYHKMMVGSTRLKTSSVGRLFDGVASLLGLCDKSSYEGEAAQYVEQYAERSCGGQFCLSQNIFSGGFSAHALMEELVTLIREGVAGQDVAWQFHLALVRWMAAVAREQKITRLAFSGGVFQNALLVRLIRETLRGEYELFFHRALSPNDECISFGQHAWHSLHRQNQSKAGASWSYLTLT